MKAAAHGGRKIIILLLACVLCVTGVLAYRHFHKSPGEGEDASKIGGFTAGQPLDSSGPEASFGEGEVKGQANATIMVYIVGSNLESEGGAASSDIAEMVNSGFDFDHNHLLIMTGGSKAWRRSTGIPADALTIYELGPGSIEEVSSSALASMGNPDTLTSFLTYCYTYYPAESYGLILWDHGGGPMMGYGEDELFRDNLDMKEIVKGLKESPFGPTNKLAFLGFDACLMGSAEVAWFLKDYAEYMIASEEVIPGGGWDYRFLSELNGKTMDGAKVGQAVVDSYKDFYEKNLAGQAILERLTLACIDLTKADQMEAALDDLFMVMSEDLATGSYSEIAQIRESVLPFAKYTTNSNYDLIDLGDMADKLSAYHPQQAKALYTAVDDMVVCFWSPLTRAHGLTLYYPFDNKEYYSAAWGEEYPSFGFAPVYTQFLQDFVEKLLGGSSKSWRDAGLPPLEQEPETDEYYFQLTPEQAADYLNGSYYLLRKVGDGAYTICGMRQDVVLDEQNRLHPNFQGNSVYVTDDEGHDFATMYYNYGDMGGQDYHVAAVLMNDPVTAEKEGKDTHVKPVLFLASLDEVGDSVPLITAIDWQGNGAEVAKGKEECKITDYDCIYYVLMETQEARDESGRLLPASQWDAKMSSMFAYFDTDTNWRAELRPLGDDGYEYFIQLIAEDTYGQEYGSELIPITLTEKGEENREEMFDNTFFPLPEKEGPAPQVGDLHELPYFQDAERYRELEVQETLVLDDPSGIRMTLVGAVQRLALADSKPKDLILIFRLDNQSRYFDGIALDYEGGIDPAIRIGDTTVPVTFLDVKRELGVHLQYGGSYYYEIIIPYDAIPDGAKTASCIFRMWQWGSTSQMWLDHYSDRVEFPLP